MPRWSGWCPGCLLPILLSNPAVVLAQSATGFDATGVATVRVGSHADDDVRGAVRLASGAVLLAGTFGSGDSSQAFVARLLPDGRADPSFGTGGVATLPAPSAGVGVAAHPGGGMMLSGTAGPFGARQVMVARFSDAGVLDAGYGDGGIATATVPGLTTAAGLAVSGAGLAHVTGSAGDPFRTIVVRFDATGTPDPLYGDDGVAMAGANTWGSAITLTNAGVAFVAGSSGAFADRDLTVFCFTTTGVPSAVFGGGTGMATSTLGVTQAYGTAIVLDGSNRPVVAGVAENPNAAAVARFTAAGAVDGTFNGGLGFRTLGFAGVSNPSSIAIDGSGRIVVGGMQADALSYGGTRRAMVARLTGTGAPDLTFGSAGRRTAELLGNDEMVGIGVDAGTGRILLAGSTAAIFGRPTAATLAVTDDGGVDDTYAAGGSVLAPLSSVVSSPVNGMALQADGRILLAGTATFTDGHRPYVARLNRDGTLDPSFGSGGVVTLPTALALEAGRITVAADGRIVVTLTQAGQSVTNALARLDASGSFDSGFGAAGLATLPQVPHPIYATLEALPDGSTLGAGVQNDSPGGMLVARFGPGGAPDASFGPAPGGVTTVLVGGSDWAYDVVVLPDGRILAAGNFYDGGSLPGLLRLTPNGAPDPTFDGDGMLSLAFPGIARAVLSAGDDGILVGGDLLSGGGVFLSRFDRDGVADATFGVGGTVNESTVAPTADVTGLVLDDAGCIVAGGLRGDDLVTRQVAIARYLPDGSADPTFGTGGGMTASVGSSPSTSAFRLDADGNALVAGTVRSGVDRVGLVARFPAACNDGNGCTVDACTAGVGCAHTQLTGLAGARCLCGVLPASCAGLTPPSNVSRKADKACSLLAAADEGEGKKRKRALAKARRLLQQAKKNTARAGRGRKPKLEKACADALGAAYGEQRARAQEALRPG
jgi:uncharacterized delta-60 repeat protein